MGIITLSFAVMNLECDQTIDPVTETVATPTISPNGGDFIIGEKVTLTCATADATIYYTVNDSEPTVDSTEYTAPFTVSGNAVVKSIAVKVGFAPSVIATALVVLLLHLVQR